MLHHAPTGVRRHRRPRVLTLVTLGVVVSGSVAMAPSASAAPAAQKAFVSAPVYAAPAVYIPNIPSQAAFAAAARAASRASQAATPLATTATLWSDKKSVRTGGTVQLTGQVSYGLTPNLVRAQVMKLQVKSGEAWTDVATRDAAADGHVVFTVKPTKSTTYRLAYPGVPALAGSASAATTLTVISPSPATVTSGSASNAPAVAASGRGAQVVAAAAAQTGKPYQYGAAGPNAFDCSGLTLYAFRTVGITLPHNANAQKSYGTAVSRANARPGDLIVFLSGGYGYHVAIYAGGNYMYDAPNPGTPVGKHQIYGGTVIFRRLV